jgi:hypothetical protein
MILRRCAIVSQRQNSNSCVTMMMRRYLRAGTVPPPGTTSPNNSSKTFPFEKSSVVTNKKNENDKAGSSAQQPPGQNPRRLIVKRSVTHPRDDNSYSGLTGSTTADANKVGVVIQKRRRRKKSETSTEIRDASGQPILIVPLRTTQRSATKEYLLKHGIIHQGSRLPIINASSLLQTKAYCVQSASSYTNKSGTAAAHRLLRGQQDFLQVLRKLVHNTTNGESQPFILQGHGIPTQLLQEHVDLADALLRHHSDAASCSFHHHPREDENNNIENNDSPSWLDRWVRVRDQSGNHRIVPWPPRSLTRTGDDSYSWQESMQLYMTVMYRLATRLGTSVLVMPREEEDSHDNNQEEQGTHTVDDYDNEFHAVPSERDAAVPHHWNVEFARKYSHNTYVDDTDPLRLTAEWDPIPEGLSSPGHVRLQLQGLPRKNDHAVTLTLDASFGLLNTDHMG